MLFSRVVTQTFKIAVFALKVQFELLSFCSQEANFSMLPKEYLESISMNDKNIVQACLMSSKDSATRNALTLIMAKVSE
jgi:hypothetical protein